MSGNNPFNLVVISTVSKENRITVFGTIIYILLSLYWNVDMIIKNIMKLNEFLFLD